jgi:aspartate/tyrosine/aromatic aminotransferase
MSQWASVPAAPLDPILGMSQRFQADTDPRKVNVSIGAYRTDEGKPLVLNCVKKAEKLILENSTLNKEYLPQRGDVSYTALCQKMLFGEDSPLVAVRVFRIAYTLHTHTPCKHSFDTPPPTLLLCTRPAHLH